MTCTAGCIVAALVLRVTGLPAQELPSAAETLGHDSQARADTAGLFSSHELLTLTIEAPFKTIFKERDQESSYHPALLRYEDSQGSPATVDLKIKTRGLYRLKRSTCNFPPLMLNFPRKQLDETLFANQDKLKLVPHCQDKRSEYEQYVLQEYLIYRTFNLLTDLSFRVRLARITYVDTESDRDPLTKYAFLIEDKEAMATRNGWEGIEVPIVPPDVCDQEQLSLVEVFQYLMGNTDWDAFQAPPGEPECCHNVKVIGNLAGPAFTVPYDFDFAGVIATRYAKPDKSLPIRSVRDRLFRGICRPREELDETLRVFNEQKQAIYALYQNQMGLEEKYLNRTIKYFDEFYKIVNDSRRVTRELVRNCRKT